MSRLQSLRNYAQKLSESFKRLKTAVIQSLKNLKVFLSNIVSIFFVTIRRGIELLWGDLVNFIKSSFRLIVDAIRWPFEHLILPFTRWLAAKSSVLLTMVKERDEYAMGLFLLLMVICVISCACLISSFSWRFFW